MQTIVFASPGTQTTPVLSAFLVCLSSPSSVFSSGEAVSRGSAGFAEELPVWPWAGQRLHRAPERCRQIKQIHQPHHGLIGLEGEAAADIILAGYKYLRRIFGILNEYEDATGMLANKKKNRGN